MIFLHAGLANSDYWGYQIPEVAMNHEVIVVDMRGHGRSTMPDEAMTYDLMASDVVGLMDFLNISNAAIVGWSDGAIVGLVLAIKFTKRVNKLFAFGANFNRRGLIPDGVHDPVFSAYRARVASEYRMLSPQPDRYPLFLQAMRQMWSAEPDFTKSQLATINIPTRVVDGDHDEIISLPHTKELAFAIAPASLVIEPGVSHFSMLQNPGRFTADVISFLDRE